MKIESDILKTVAVIVVLVGVFGGVVYWPSSQQDKVLAQEIQDKQQKLNEIPLPNLEPLRAEIASLRAELRERAVTLPAGDHHDRVLHHVSDTLIDNDVVLYETSYSKPEFYSRFAVTPIDVDFEGRFTQAFNVLRQIESDGPPVRLERLEMYGDPDDTSGQVKVNVEMSSFFLPREGGAR